MKRVILSIVSFVFIFFFIQWSLGMIVTAFYTPGIAEAWKTSGHLPQEVVLHRDSYLSTILIAIGAALVVYLVPKTIKRFST
ncbi:hypothetical protein KFZ56_00585 [Virgibacillus sp. NKC19-3]|uniref:hypothetical protein n=1 Tax=Virgibacillus saliphilus TaxID=2831674 RepID=UPI001C9B2259|nr:hypothetical protein [Virgibacillus sp. NKC19-3]MBY7141625.1 hypothetical protein [Virgibacillus sp. NKC19-3]